MSRRAWSRAATDALAVLAGLAWLIPFMGVLAAALRPQSEILYGWWRLPATVSLDNFMKAWNHPTAALARGLWNSLLVAVPATMVPVLVGALAAYGVQRLPFRGKPTLLMGIALLLAVPQQMIAVPLFQLMVSIGLIDTYPGLILVHSAWALPWILFFLSGYLAGLPWEVEEAAAIDGASRYQSFFYIILPLMMPALASVAALQLTWTWNDFFMALILVFDPDKLLATQRIPLLRGQFHVDWGVLSAGAVLTMAVPVVVFLLLQRYYIQGLVGGTVK